MLAVMNLHRLRIDVRLERPVVVRERRQRVLACLLGCGCGAGHGVPPLTFGIGDRDNPATGGKVPPLARGARLASAWVPGIFPTRLRVALGFALTGGPRWRSSPMRASNSCCAGSTSFPA